MRTRGTGKNPHNRFQTIVTDREVSDGWWYQDPEDETCPDSLVTQVMEEYGRSIISHNQSPDIPFEQSINPYRGCEHGCVYCFARPTHAYWDLSPGLDFETRLIAKPGAPSLLRQELDRPGYQCRPIALGMNTDAYQPIEKHRGITRALLEVLLEYRHPVAVITKGALILRDLDLLSELADLGLSSASISLTTLDNDLKRRMEPRTAAPATRLRMIRELVAAGVPTGVILGPVIPFVNDHEIEAMIQAAADAGATRASWIMLRLPHEVSGLFEDWLRQHFPARADHVMNRIRDLRGGKTYDATFGRRMTGEGAYAELIRQRFDRKTRAVEMNLKPRKALRCDLFRRPAGEQMTLL